MKALTLTLAFLALTSPALANPSRTLCGGSNSDGAQIRLLITLDQQDEFSPATITSINGARPGKASNTKAEAYGFGFRGYESIALALKDACSGKASYKHYNAQMPMNPMETLNLKCICK